MVLNRLKKIFEAHDHKMWDEDIDRVTTALNYCMKAYCHGIASLGKRSIILAEILIGKR